MIISYLEIKRMCYYDKHSIRPHIIFIANTMSFLKNGKKRICYERLMMGIKNENIVGIGEQHFITTKS